ncbi:MAG: biopolymer transporter ExbD [Bacteroidaceae bacterium]|jgi:biopolymer transport protein ExbD|nr:biopolymer transporter ExbD [Bacteroidaceae bacterium]MBQ9523748.1 biopolymer transporter ExbD [Bacteroidaceae bacterium]MBR6171504.1 biopolymer transporter ExbD [Bacteroidaceae bacterium]
MAKKKKKMPGLNTSSTADISFMLLIFFLVTTSMDTDMGLARHLPQPPDPDQEDAQVDIKARNILYVRLNFEGQLWIEDETTRGYADIKELRQRVKEFVKNEQNYSKWPEKHVKILDHLGRCYVTDKHVISVQTDRGTPYDAYFQVQNELVAAYSELRNELAKEKFGREYQYLDDEIKDVIRKQYYPQNISEAEPKKYGGTK